MTSDTNTGHGSERNSAPPPYSVQPERPSTHSTGPPRSRVRPTQRPQRSHSPIEDATEGSTDETEPLLPRRGDQNDQYSRGKRRFALTGRRIIPCFLFVALIVGVIIGPIITFKTAKLDNCPEAEQMERDRAKWAFEKRMHDAAVEERGEVYQLWRMEDATHVAKLKYWDEEDLERDEIRKEWHREVGEHEREEQGREEVRKEWEREVFEHERFERERQEREAREREEVRRKWEREVGEHEREERERRKRELEERQQMGFFWADVEASHCVRHETRKYTARLADVPDGYEHRVEACKETELSINGRSKTPTQCDDKGVLGVYGVWEEEGDAACGTYFNWFKDKGCTAPNSGLRRYEMYMENLRQGDDWEAMCSSTPATFLDMYFAHPDSCTQWNEGTYGFWGVRDSSCW